MLSDVFQKAYISPKRCKENVFAFVIHHTVMSEELASNRGSYKPQKMSTKDFEARIARALASAYIYHS